MLHRCGMRLAFGLCTVLLVGAPSLALEGVFFPGDTGVVNITKAPYFADSTGRTDATAAIDSALHTVNKRWQVIYFPRGTYLVSHTLDYGDNNSNGPVFIGQDRKRTVIKLKSGSYTSAPTGNAYNAVIRCGDGVAQNFNKGLHNLTVYISSNNLGADGVYWYGNNISLMSEVDIIAQDNTAGRYGLNLGYGEQGPCMVRDVYVKGCAKGVWSDALNSVTVMRLTVEGQREHGVYNNHRYLYIDSLTSINTVQAVYNHMDMTLVNARLTGGGSSVTAINSLGRFFGRGIVTQGYQRAITSSQGTAPTGTTIKEFSTHAAQHLFNSPDTSMNLPVEYPPTVLWEQDRAKWANVLSYKSAGAFQPRRADSTAFRMALEAPGVTSVVVPYGTSFDLGGRTYSVRGTIARIVGTGGSLGNGILEIGDGTAPVVKIERCAGMSIVNRSSRTVIIESTPNVPISLLGSGKTFLIDIGVPQSTPLVIDNAGAQVWGWQVNMECCPQYDAADRRNLVMNNGIARIFGYKSESKAVKTHIVGGALEMLGMLQYCQSWNVNMSGEPMWVIYGGHFSLAGMSQVTFSNELYSTLVRETRNGQTLNFLSSGNPAGGDLPLYTAYDPATMPVRAGRPIVKAQHPVGAATAVTLTAGVMHIAYTVTSQTRVSWSMMSATGRTVAHGSSMAAPGSHTFAVDLASRPNGAYYVNVRVGDVASAQRVVVAR